MKHLLHYSALLLLLVLLPSSLSAEVVGSGSCGDNLVWSYNDETHELKIEGKGSMKNYSYYGPWRSYVSEIAAISLPSGLTNIGNYAFSNCSSLASITRITRASMIDALNLDCIKTARAKGLREKVVVYSHAWRNAMVPMVSILVGGFFGIISGAIIMERMFGFKGLGQLFFNAVITADYDLIMFLEVIYTFLGLFSTLVTDLCYGLVDPRVRISK